MTGGCDIMITANIPGKVLRVVNSYCIHTISSYIPKFLDSSLYVPVMITDKNTEPLANC